MSTIASLWGRVGSKRLTQEKGKRETPQTQGESIDVYHCPVAVLIFLGYLPLIIYIPLYFHSAN
ncbi:hypothetical protein [Photobacterium makurazakiensis]|uniref:hypothetical protein n=1 Tax=Photobacterium makurazakiensis TaxID=2910234 RepID=UPI003D0CEABD